MNTPKWIIDAVRELGLVDILAVGLAPRLLNNIPQTALLALADVACHRAQLDGSDASGCARDLVKSIMEVLTAGDTESGELAQTHIDAWVLLNELGIPLGDEGRVFSLVDRIRILGSELRRSTDYYMKADEQASELQDQVFELQEHRALTGKVHDQTLDLVTKLRARVAELESMCGPVPRLEDNQIDTPIEVERLENVLRFIGNNCENPEMVRDFVSRGLRGKSVP